MKRLWLALLLVAACETRAAEPPAVFLRLSELDGPAVACVQEVLAVLPTETEGHPRLDCTPKSLEQAHELIEAAQGEPVDPFLEACEASSWMIFSQVPADDAHRFRRGWAVETVSLEIYPYSLKR